MLKIEEVSRPGGADQYVFDHISFHESVWKKLLGGKFHLERAFKYVKSV